MRIRNCVACGDWLAGEDREASQKNGGLCIKCAIKGGHESTRMFVLAQLGAESSGRLPANSPLMQQLAQETTAAPDPSRQAKNNGTTLPRQIPTPELTPKATAGAARSSGERVVVIHFCSKCGQRLSSADILLGRPRNMQGDIVSCNECAQTDPEKPLGEGVLKLFMGARNHQRTTGPG